MKKKATAKKFRRRPTRGPDALCRRCGHPEHQHALVNYADGPFVGLTHLVCPTSIFQK